MKKKRSFLHLSALMLCVMLMLSSCSIADLLSLNSSRESGGLVFVMNEDKKSYTLDDIGTCTDSTVIVPATFKDLPVTKIGEGAFEMCIGISSVVLPETIEEIETDAFYDCAALQAVEFSPNLTKIGDNAFAMCLSLQMLDLPEGLKTVGANAFAGCASLRTVILPDTVTTVGEGAFALCTELMDVFLSKNLTAIPKNSFAGCTRLVEISIPDSVETVGESAFTACARLTKVEMTGGVKYIDLGAFAGCRRLSYISIPETLKTLGSGVFSGCERLGKITYGGSKAQWGKVRPDADWSLDMNSGTVIECTDGQLDLQGRVIKTAAEK